MGIRGYGCMEMFICYLGKVKVLCCGVWIRWLICCAVVLYPFAIDWPTSSSPKALGLDISMRKCCRATLRVMAWPWERVIPLMVMVGSFMGYSKGS